MTSQCLYQFWQLRKTFMCLELGVAPTQELIPPEELALDLNKERAGIGMDAEGNI